MRVALLVIAFVACKDSSKSAPTPTPVPVQLDPKGPCAKIEGSTCKEHDPLFGETLAAARVELPATSPQTKKYLARFSPPAGKKIDVSIEAVTVGQIRVYHWEPAKDGWIATSDGFSPAEPHAQWGWSYVPASAGEQMVAIVAEGEMVVKVTAQ